MHIAEVNFDEGNLYAQQGIAQRHTGVGEAPGFSRMKSIPSLAARWTR
jgi:hypothetical protein